MQHRVGSRVDVNTGGSAVGAKSVEEAASVSMDGSAGSAGSVHSLTSAVRLSRSWTAVKAKLSAPKAFIGEPLKPESMAIAYIQSRSQSPAVYSCAHVESALTRVAFGNRCRTCIR